MPCIFCKSSVTPSTTVEHILPESLGGDDSFSLPRGVVCDQCQMYFGAKIERFALAQPPLAIIRTLNFMHTKRDRAPEYRDPVEGLIVGGRLPGELFYRPAPWLERAVSEGRKTQMRLLSHLRNPRVVCRFLLKIGVEAVAFFDGELALDHRYDPAREFARRGRPGTSWWFLQHGNGRSLVELSAPPPDDDNNDFLSVGIYEPVVGMEMLHLRAANVDLIAPLLPEIQPDPESSFEGGLLRV